MTQTPKYARLQSELQDLARRFGIPQAELTADELAALVHACDRCDAPYTRGNSSVVFRDIQAGGVILHPLSVGAWIWLEQYAWQWWAKTSDEELMATVYAAAHSNDPAAFRNLTDKETARAAIVDFALSLAGCDYKELAAGLDRAFGIEEEKNEEAESNAPPAFQKDWQGIIAELAAQTGIPREKWEWESMDFTRRAWFYARRKLLASFGAKLPRDPFDEIDTALAALARVKLAIWKAHKPDEATP